MAEPSPFSDATEAMLERHYRQRRSMRSDAERDEDHARFVNGMVRYMKTHDNWSEFTAEAAVRNVLWMILGDIGASQSMLDAIGVQHDLYDHGRDF